MAYSARCTRCRRLLPTETRIGDAELACLRHHARRCFAHDAPADDAHAGNVLRHFDIVRADPS